MFYAIAIFAIITFSQLALLQYICITIICDHKNDCCKVYRFLYPVNSTVFFYFSYRESFYPDLWQLLLKCILCRNADCVNLYYHVWLCEFVLSWLNKAVNRPWFTCKWTSQYSIIKGSCWLEHKPTRLALSVVEFLSPDHIMNKKMK